MATTFKMVYVAPDVAVTITLASLASSATAGRESTVISNTTNLDLDHQLFAFFTPQAGTPANDKGVYVYGYGTAGTTVYPDNVTGADAALTPTSEGNLTLMGFVNIAVSTTRGGKFLGSVATAFGSMPEKLGYWVRDYCGFALSATGSASGVTYNRVQTQGV
jgi:hypothetical protein